MKSPNKLSIIFNVSILACTISNCTNHPQTMKIKIPHISEIPIIDIDQGNKLLINSNKQIYKIGSHGEGDTPEILVELLDLFEKFAQKKIPTGKAFYQMYLPQLILYLSFIYWILDNKEMRGIQEHFYIPSEKNKMFFSFYGNAVVRFQDNINTIFSTIEKQFPQYLSSRPYILRINGNATLKAGSEDAAKNIIKLLQEHFNNPEKSEVWKSIVAYQKGCFISRNREVYKELENEINNLKKNIHKHMLLWQKRQENYFIACVNNATYPKFLPRLLKPLWYPEVEPVMFCITGNNIETRAGFSLTIYSNYNSISITVFVGKEQRTGHVAYFTFDNDKFTIIKDACSKMQDKCSYVTFPEPTHASFKNMQNREIYIIFPEPTEKAYDYFIETLRCSQDNPIYAFLGLYFGLPTDQETEIHMPPMHSATSSISTYTSTTSCSQESTGLEEEEEEQREETHKQYKRKTKTERRKQQRAQEERIQNQKQRNTKRLETCLAQWKQRSSKYNDLVDLLNIFHKVYPPKEDNSTSNNRGSHRTLHNASGCISLVVPHGKQKGNEVSAKQVKKTMQQLSISHTKE